ncbi:hypothetical protein GO988_10395 [Hymenobacter sp. HMF4947]|uniref:Uncharacterized protein n=1 Tax=Hymenobacter ginkgonis TaxID=2682976 RepID=A0A7K1TEA8_9BACT|nr:hypothetical protein [Hymenobacter ginkgonis]MVN76730.1 hypothetical protein [Hymenobacter ginkgonis]
MPALLLATGSTRSRLASSGAGILLGAGVGPRGRVQALPPGKAEDK